MQIRSLVALLAASLFASCSSPVEGPERAGAGAMAPIVTGIRVTFENGVFAGNWGNPTDGPAEVKPSRYPPGLMVLAPNPCIGKSPITYNVLKSGASVRLWVSPARLAGALGTDLESIFGANMAAPRMTTARTLKTGVRLEAGTHTADWDGTDDAGNPVPSGFYRIYLSIDDTFYWRDLLFFASRDDADRFSLKIGG